MQEVLRPQSGGRSTFGLMQARSDSVTLLGRHEAGVGCDEWLMVIDERGDKGTGERETEGEVKKRQLNATHKRQRKTNHLTHPQWSHAD